MLFPLKKYLISCTILINHDLIIRVRCLNNKIQTFPWKMIFALERTMHNPTIKFFSYSLLPVRPVSRSASPEEAVIQIDRSIHSYVPLFVEDIDLRFTTRCRNACADDDVRSGQRETRSGTGTQLDDVQRPFAILTRCLCTSIRLLCTTVSPFRRSPARIYSSQPCLFSTLARSLGSRPTTN